MDEFLKDPFWRFLGKLRSKEVQKEWSRFSGTVLLERM